MLEPREAVRKMALYHPPSAGRDGKLRLDFNENTVGCSPAVIEFLRDHLTASQLSIYPEYVDAMRELAAFFGVSEDEFTLTNGTDEAIQVLVNTFVDDGDEVVVLKPSYAMYRFYAEVAGAVVREVEYSANTLVFPMDELLAAVTPKTRAVLIANPNNPTGSAIFADEIQRILESAPQAALLIDEAYFDFFQYTALPWIRRFPNLFVSRTFSKAYGMAAMRCGCLFSGAENVSWMKKAQSPYSVNTLAVIAAQAAVADTAYIQTYVAEVLAARELLCVGLEKFGIGYVPSSANFVLANLGKRAIEVRDELRAQGILVRDRSYEAPGCVRMTVGTREQTRRLLAALEEIWNR